MKILNLTPQFKLAMLLLCLLIIIICTGCVGPDLREAQQVCAKGAVHTYEFSTRSVDLILECKG